MINKQKIQRDLRAIVKGKFCRGSSAESNFLSIDDAE